MAVTVEVEAEVVGEDTLVLTFDASAEPTYLDVLEALELSPHEVSVLVDGRPVPEDRPISTDHVRILRMIAGG